MADQKTIDSMIRVNHAGEFGAMRIYEGQLTALRHHPHQVALLQEMKEQEKEHLAYFTQALVERQIMPTVLQPLWYVGGYALGYITGLMGEKVAHACTIAVEEVIEEHYQDQLNELQHDPEEKELRGIIQKFQADEAAHRHTAHQEGGAEAPFYTALTTVIKGISKTAIWLSQRV